MSARDALRRKQHIAEAKRNIVGLQQAHEGDDTQLVVPMHGFEQQAIKPTLLIHLRPSFPEYAPELYVDCPLEHAWVDSRTWQVHTPCTRSWNKYTTSLTGVIAEALDALAGFPVSSNHEEGSQATEMAVQNQQMPRSSNADSKNQQCECEEQQQQQRHVGSQSSALRAAQTDGSKISVPLSPREMYEQEGEQLIESLLQNVMAATESMSDAQLEGMLSSADSLDQLAAEALINHSSAWREALKHNKWLAEQNAELARSVSERRTSANVVRSSELDNGLLERYNNLKSRHDALVQRFHPQKLIEATEAAAQEAADESNQRKQSLVSTAEGMNEFRDARFRYHYRKALASAARSERSLLEDDFQAGR